MHRPELRIASLFVLLTACPGEVIEDPTGSSSESGETTSTTKDSTTKDSTTTNLPTTTQPDTTEPTTTSTTLPPDTTSTSTTTETTVDPPDTTTTGETTDTTAGTTVDTTGTTVDTTTGTTTDTDGTTTDTDGTTTMMMSLCANGALDPGEVCDADLLDGKTCLTEGFDAGTLACAADCNALDTAGCVMFSCGNNNIEGNEVCDGTSLANETCSSQGFAGGTLACAANCGTFDTSGCFKCGNDLVDGADLCDGTDLAGKTCATQGFDGGTLDCAADCASYITSGCFDCGDNTINGAEICDGTALGGQTCTSQGFDGGPLTCAADCSGYVTTACTDCGNNVIEGNEVCDGTALAGQTCVSQGATAGNLACKADCSAFDKAACSTCGNSIVEGTEQCDSASLGGATCVSLGANSGSLSCFNSCSFNATQCLTNVDESEPNDDTMVAVSTNDFSAVNADGPYSAHTLIHGAITPLGDDDVYAITNTTGLPATLRLETFGPGGPGTCAAVDTDIYLYTAAQMLLISADQGGIGNCSLIPSYPIAAGETLYLRVIDWQDNTLINSYYLDIQITPVICGDGILSAGEQCEDGNLANNDGCSSTCKIEGTTAEIEPNNTNAQADGTGLVSTGDTLYTGAITPVADLDRYKIDLAASKFLRMETFSTTNNCAGITTTMRLFNSANVSLINDTEATLASGIQGCSAIVFPVPTGASYLQVEETGNNAIVPFYLLDIQELADAGSETEPNEVIATASANVKTGTDKLVFGDHTALADVDFYAIDVPQGGSLRLEVIEGDRTVETCESNGIDAYLTLYNSNGMSLGIDDDDGRGFCSAIDGTGVVPRDNFAHNLAAGTYYVSVIAAPGALNDAAKTFTYRLNTTVRKP